MMNALLVLSLLCQGEVGITGQGRHHGGDYELTVIGKGKNLQEQAAVSLRFRRLVNRLNWEDGSIGTRTLEDEAARVAAVEKNQFVHREVFKAPGEVEVRIGLPHAEEAAPLTRLFRTSSLPEEAFALGSAAKRFEIALRGARTILQDVEAMKCDPCLPGKKMGRLQKRIEWHLAAARQEIADNFLTASSHALGLLLSDFESGYELERMGKGTAEMRSALTGMPFSWEEAQEQIAEIEAVSLRERSLLALKTMSALANQAAAWVHTGASGGWSRVEKEFLRTIETIQEGDHELRTGPMAGRYAALVDVADARFEDAIVKTKEYLQAASGCLQCAKSTDSDFAARGQALMDQFARFEVRARTRN